MPRILDLGCGVGDSWRKSGHEADDWQLVGVDIAPDRLRFAREKYGARGWSYVCARGENLPLATGRFEGALCWLSLPYMHIPKALAEIHRVLAPGAWFIAALHTPSFTWSEFRNAFPRLKPCLFRVFVLLNGIILHFAGSVISVGGKAESCQTESGMRTAMRRAGFTSITFHRSNGKLLVRATRDDGAVSQVPALQGVNSAGEYSG